MTPEEKWQRLNHPTCLDDYGIIISEAEARKIPEARKIITRSKKLQHSAKIQNKIIKSTCDMFGRHIDNMIITAASKSK